MRLSAWSRACAVVAVAGALTGPAPAGSAAQPAPTVREAGATSTLTLRAALRRLEVGRERRAGYDRDDFGSGWTDADGDCRDTRDEVLASESRQPVGRDCDVAVGLWRSYYDGLWWRDSSDVDIDHLAEAWDSGARGWSGRARLRFANDLGDDRALVAVTDNVNQSKGDRDPAEWLPERRVCRYTAEYLAVKVRWSLRVDRPERRALRELVGACPVRRITVTSARA
jgi:hypothetical protein